MPTVLEVLGIQLPLTLKGVPQEEIAGRSLTPTFADANAEEVRPTQYYECTAHGQFITMAGKQ